LGLVPEDLNVAGAPESADPVDEALRAIDTGLDQA